MGIESVNTAYQVVYCSYYNTTRTICGIIILFDQMDWCDVLS